MRSRLTVTLATFFIGVASHTLAAQSLARPGQLAPASKTIIEPGSYSSINPSKIDFQEERHDRIANRVWIGSLIAVVAASGMDAATSFGKTEGNPLLASSNGTFGAKGITIKAGLSATTLIVELLSRKDTGMRKAFTIFNFGEAALFSTFEVHNLGIAAPK